MTTPVSRYLPPMLLGLSVVLAVANWYLDPAHVRSWATALSVLACMSVALSFFRPSSSSRAWRDAADYIRNGVVFGALMLAIPLSFKLARALGGVEDADLSRRLTMVVFGVFFMFTGNLVPKLLTPLSAQQCDGARMQAWQRFTGWTWVLAGLAYAVVWLVLPSDVAEPVSVAFLIGGVLLAMVRAVQTRRTRHTEA